MDQPAVRALSPASAGTIRSQRFISTGFRFLYAIERARIGLDPVVMFPYVPKSHPSLHPRALTGAGENYTTTEKKKKQLLRNEGLGPFLTGLQRNPIGQTSALPQLPAPCAPCSCRVEAISSLLEGRKAWALQSEGNGRRAGPSRELRSRHNSSFYCQVP